MNVIAYRMRESKRCPSCGTFPDEWLDDKGRVLMHAPYEAELVACQGCRELAVVQEEVDKAKDPGVRAVLKVNDGPLEESEEI